MEGRTRHQRTGESGARERRIVLELRETFTTFKYLMWSRDQTFILHRIWDEDTLININDYLLESCDNVHAQRIRRILLTRSSIILHSFSVMKKSTHHLLCVSWELKNIHHNKTSQLISNPKASYIGIKIYKDIPESPPESLQMLANSPCTQRGPICMYSVILTILFGLLYIISARQTVCKPRLSRQTSHNIESLTF